LVIYQLNNYNYFAVLDFFKSKIFQNLVEDTGY